MMMTLPANSRTTRAASSSSTRLRSGSSSSFLGGSLAAALAVAAASAWSSPATVAEAVLLDFEGFGDNAPIGNFYGGGGGGPKKNHGIVFGAGVLAAIDSDAGGTHPLANEPSPNTTMYFAGNQSQWFMTVLGAGFTGLSFQYVSFLAVNVTVYGGPNMTGAVVGGASLPIAGFCADCDRELRRVDERHRAFHGRGKVGRRLPQQRRTRNHRRNCD